MVLTQLSLRNGEETGEPCFGREKIVIPFVHIVFADVVSYGKEIARFVKQKPEVHIGCFVTSVGKHLQRADAFQRVQGAFVNGASQLGEPVVYSVAVAFFESSGEQNAVNPRNQRLLQPCFFTKREYMLFILQPCVQCFER